MLRSDFKTIEIFPKSSDLRQAIVPLPVLYSLFEMLKITRIIRTRRKTTALIIHRDGSLVIRAPLQASDEAITKWVASKEEWIRAKQAQFQELYPKPAVNKFIDGEEFLYLGTQYPLIIIKNNKPLLLHNSNFELSQFAQGKAKIVFKQWYRKQAAKIFSERINWYAARHGFSYKGIRLSSAKTRWGSCSTSGALSIVWRLIMAPLHVIDYVIVHELVHLEIKNHSKDFWGKVGSILPDYKFSRNWLKKYGHQLELD